MRSSLCLSLISFLVVNIQSAENPDISIDENTSLLRDDHRESPESSNSEHHAISLKFSRKQNFVWERLLAACGWNSGKSTEKVLPIPILIRKGALSAIDKKVSSSQFQMTQDMNNSNNGRKTDISRPFQDENTIEINLNEFAHHGNRNSELLVEDLKILLVQFFNEYCYINGEIINKPHFAKRVLEYVELKSLVYACSRLEPNFNSWCRLLSNLALTLHNLSIHEVSKFVRSLIDEWGFLDSIITALKNTLKVDEKPFVRTLKLLAKLIVNLETMEDQTIRTNLAMLSIQLLRCLARFGTISLFEETNQTKMNRIMAQFWRIIAQCQLNLTAQEIEQYEMTLSKKYLMKWFINTLTHLDTSVSGLNLVTVENWELLAWFSIIFTPGALENPNDISTAKMRLKECFEHYLFSFEEVSFACISLNKLNKEPRCVTELPLLLKEAIEQVSKKLVVDNKVFIFLKSNELQQIRNKLNENELPVLLAALKSYLVLTGGDGIIMVYIENEPTSENSNTGNSPNRYFKGSAHYLKIFSTAAKTSNKNTNKINE